MQDYVTAINIFDAGFYTVILKTDGTTGQDGASLPQLAAISSP